MPHADDGKRRTGARQCAENLVWPGEASAKLRALIDMLPALQDA